MKLWPLSEIEDISLTLRVAKLITKLLFCLQHSSEAERLSSTGVNIIIALGHSGYDKDREIGINCPLIDVVIGGHSHSFLYSGDHSG